MSGIPPETYRNLLLTVGSRRARRPLSPVQVAAALDQLVRAGTPLADVARGLQLEGTSILNRFLQLRRLPPEVSALVDWGRTKATLAFTTAVELTRLPPPEATTLATAAVEHQLSKDEVRSVVQLRVRSSRPLDACLREVLEARPQVTRLHLLIGSVTNPEVRDRLSPLPQAERDEVMRAAFARAFPEVTGATTRLAADRFAISGSDDVAAAVSLGGRDFEAATNVALAAEVLGVAPTAD